MALLASRFRPCVFWSRLLPGSTVSTLQTPHRNLLIQSQLFPEYSLMFELENIRSFGRFNRIKFQSTILTAAGIPSLFAMEQLGFVLPDTVYGFTFWGSAITIFLHSVGVLFNNTVGFIYIKDEENIKISYVDYWGNRKNFDTTVANVYALSDAPSRFSNPWYERLCLIDSNKTFKMYLTLSKILDNESFEKIFGKVYS